jgi:agmatinase
MKKTYNLWPFNFGAVHRQDFSQSKVVVVQLPYESTVSFNTGTGSGPHSIINNSRYLDEMLDAVDGENLVGMKSTDVYTLDDAELSKNSVKEAMEGIERLIRQEVLLHNKVPMVLGGEHSVTYGVIKAIKKKFKDISVLQFDAHADLINEYEGSKYSHACVMRRIHDLHVPITSVGIRNINQEAENFIQKNNIRSVHYAPGIPPIEKILKSLTKNVYITFDLDAFDPSIMPSVGTAEPGGLGWYETINCIKEISQHVHIVGADVVELKPIPGLDAPNFLAAKLTYHLIKSIISSHEK